MYKNYIKLILKKNKETTIKINFLIYQLFYILVFYNKTVYLWLSQYELNVVLLPSMILFMDVFVFTNLKLSIAIRLDTL